MTNLPFIVELKRLLPEATLPWVVAGLHHDNLVWSELRGELGSRVLESLQEQSNAYLPGVISLVALGHPDPLEILPLIRSKPASEVYHFLSGNTSPQIGSNRLEEAGIKALQMLELWSVASSWEGLENKLNSITPCVAACLYSLLDDPTGLLLTLITEGRSDLAVHAVLSNPAPHQAQADILAKTLESTNPVEILPLLRQLFVQRPVLAVGLAQKILQSSWWEHSKDHHIATPHITLLDKQYSHIMGNLFRAEIYRLAAQPNLAVPIMRETIQLSRHLQAEIAAQLARAAAEDDDWKSSLSAWEQASRLYPESLEHLGGFLLALVEDNQYNKADALISEHPIALEFTDGQPLNMMLARAEIALQSDQRQKAQAYACDALEQLKEISRSHLNQLIDPRLPVTLARLFLQLAMPDYAVQAAQAAMLIKPDNVEACGWLANSLLSAGCLEDAVEQAHLAVALAPDRLDLRTSLVELLEAAQDWQSAYEERQLLISRSTNPTSADLHRLAAAALHAGNSDHASQLCEQLLTADNQDGEAIAILAHALAQQELVPEALELLNQAKQDIPSHPSPWLALAQILRDSGDLDKSVETLRAAYQAAPDEPRLLLELGAGYLDENAPTQALVPLRQAFHLLQADSREQVDRHLLSQVSYLLGRTLYQLGHIEDARNALETGYYAAPYDINIANSYAQILLTADEPQNALSPLHTVIRSMPHDTQPYLDFARCLLRMDGEVQADDYQNALHYLGLAAEIAPNQPEIRALTAEVLAASGDLPSAMSAYRKALDTSLAQEPAWQIRLWLGLGKVALDLDQIETSIAALQEASLTGPDNPDVQRTLCEAYHAAGLAENAFEAAQATRDLADGDIDILIWFAQKAHDLQNQPGVFLPGARDEAVQALEQATLQATHQAQLLTRLGEIQLRLGETEAAHHTFLRLLGEGDEEIPGFQLNASPADLHKAALGLIELGDAKAAVTCLEQALQQNIEDDVKTIHRVEPKAPLRLQILTDMAYALKMAGQPLASLQTLEQAIHLDGSNIDLYLMKADLLANMDDSDGAQDFGSIDRDEIACDALETALEIDPSNASLHLQAALVMRKIGEVSKAMRHAQQAITLTSSLAESAVQHNTVLASHLLAADLARTLLEHDRALEILAGCREVVDNAEITHQIEYHCLLSELMLEDGDTEQATREISRVIELDQEDPGLLSLQSRLSLRKASVTLESSTQSIFSSAKDIFSLAVEIFNRGYPANSQQLIHPSSKPVITKDQSIRRRLAKAAQELHYWDTALDLTRQTVKSAPDEPDPHLQLARLLVLRAEFQRNCQSLEVISHSPGEQANSEETFGEYQFAIQIAEDLVLQWQESNQKRSREQGSNPSSPVPQRCIKQWQVRGTAVFCPNAQSAVDLADLPADPENIVAQIACLHSAGDLTAAGKAASQYSHDPAVLAQLAIALEDNKPRQALVAAHGALEALFSTGSPANGSQPQVSQSKGKLLPNIEIPMLLALLARLLQKHTEQAEDPSAAINAIQKALSYWADEPRWHTLAAEIYLGSSQLERSKAADEAADHLEQAIQLDPGHARAFQMLSQIYESDGKHNRALELLTKASELAPRDVNIWLQLAEVNQAAGNLGDAKECAEKAAALAPKHTKPLILLADMELKENKPEAAQARAQTALEIEPDNPDALVLTARALKAMEQPDEAITLLEKALPAASDPLPLHLEYIQLIQRARSVKDALDAAKDLSSRYPEDTRALSLLAEMLEKDGQIQPAVQAAQRALRCKSCLDTLSKEELAYLHYNLGRLLSQTGQLDQSIHQLVEAIDKSPGYVEPYLELGHVHQQRRQHSQALQAFSQAIDAAPADSRPYYHAGLALKESKDYLEAERMLRKASELAPEDVSIHRLLGAVVALNLVHNRRQSSLAG